MLPVTYVVIFAWSEQRTYKGTTKLIVLLLFFILFNVPLHHLLNIILMFKGQSCVNFVTSCHHVCFSNCTSGACIRIFIFVCILLSAVVLTVLVEFANLMFLWPGIDPLSLQKWMQFWGLHKYWLNAIVSIKLIKDKLSARHNVSDTYQCTQGVPTDIKFNLW